MIQIRTQSSRTIDQAEFSAQIDQLASQGEAPFSRANLEVLKALSARILKSPEARHAPQLIALGYWLRPAAIKRTHEQFLARVQEGQVPTSRGLAFHLPPANVDTLFVYSWVLSLLAGNANIVRLPSTLAPAADWLIGVIAETLEECGEVERHVFCAYDYRSGLSREISARSDLRMIWGGDAKVMTASADPVRPDGLSLGFSDRKSFCILKAEAYAALDEKERNDLAARLYNDIYWFDQLGCGSPRVVVWVGTPGGLNTDLYRRLLDVVKAHRYDVETGVAIAKFSFMNDMIASDFAQSGETFGNALGVLDVVVGPNVLDNVQGGGLLLDSHVETLDEVLPLVDRRTQTLATFGFSQLELMGLVQSMIGKGGFRIVPVGEALSFEETWDGVPLLDHMTRRITVRT